MGMDGWVFPEGKSIKWVMKDQAARMLIGQGEENKPSQEQLEKWEENQEVFAGCVAEAE